MPSLDGWNTGIRGYGRFIAILILFLLITFTINYSWFTSITHSNKDEEIYASYASEQKQQPQNPQNPQNPQYPQYPQNPLGPMRVILSGVARNIQEDHIRHHIPKLIKLGESFDKYHILIYENDSGPSTRNAYKEELAKTPHSTYIYEDGMIQGSRPSNIARARNKVVDYVLNNLSSQNEYDYLFVTDMDAVCGGEVMELSYDPNIFKYALSRSSEWDMIAFRFIPYWDLWAFRDDEHMPYNLFGPKSSKNNFRSSASFDHWLKTIPPTKLIPIRSAFMMMAIYKIEKIVGCRYSHVGEFQEDDCEHVAFHRDMINIHNASLRLSPLIYCQGDEGYQTLEQLNIDFQPS